MSKLIENVLLYAAALSLSTAAWVTVVVIYDNNLTLRNIVSTL